VSLLGRLVLAITRLRPVRALFTRFRIGRRVAMRFVAGETLDDAVRVARRLNDAGFVVSLDHLGEHVTDRELARRARDDYLKCLDRIAAEEIDGNISIKLTQLGLGFDDAEALAAVRSLAGRAAELGLTITIDMEESAHTRATVEVYEAVQRETGNLGIALQPTSTGPPTTFRTSDGSAATSGSARAPTTSPTRSPGATRRRSTPPSTRSSTS
jgi:proline dehydrogenase